MSLTTLGGLAHQGPQGLDVRPLGQLGPLQVVNPLPVGVTQLVNQGVVGSTDLPAVTGDETSTEPQADEMTEPSEENAEPSDEPATEEEEEKTE